MFLEPTVFILGAGASMPCGYPSGWLLVRNMYAGGPETDAMRKTRTDAGFTDKQLQQFQQALAKARPESIDQFLGWHKDFHDIGRFVIAQHLLRLESNKSLFLDDHSDPWYDSLLNAIASDPTAVKQNRITFVTFNYDRSLDHFLFEAIKNRFLWDDDKTRDAMSNIHFNHVHGQLGVLPWQARNGEQAYPYETSFTLEGITNAAKGIKIISNAEHDSDEFTRARVAIAEARWIFVFGFGYHDLNMQRLGLPINKPSPWTMGATLHKIAPARIHALREKFNRGVEFIEGTIGEFMRGSGNYYIASTKQP